MGTITQRKSVSGAIRYRAEIRIKRSGLPEYKESKTFGTMRTASNWLNKREQEIADNPDILLGINNKSMTIAAAIAKYKEEVGDEFGRTKNRSLDLIAKLPIAKVYLEQINATHVSEHVALRKKGYSKLGLDPVLPSTILNELQNIKSILTHASVMWRINVNLNEFNNACLQLRKTRQIKKSDKRDRLLSNAELKNLLLHYLDKWNRGRTAYPMHLIVLLAIFSCRRQAEITRIRLSDYDKEHQSWMVRDLKNPSGSKGNHKHFNVLPECQKIIELLMRDEIRARMLKMGGDSDLLVPLSAVAIASEFNQSCHVLGMSDFRFHDLRHEGATRLAESGLTIPQIQQVTLHDTWSSLERYVSVKKRANILQLDDLLQIIGEM